MLLSISVVALFYLGGLIASRIGVPSLGQVIKAVPIAVGTVILSRFLPRPRVVDIPWFVRLLLLSSPFLLLTFADVQFPSWIFGDLSFLSLVALDSLAIGVSEEATFRFSLHRLWAPYGAAFYVIASALLFGLLHIPTYGLGQLAIVSAIIGVIFGLARVAGMPLVFLIALHGLFDAPGVVRFLGSLR